MVLVAVLLVVQVLFVAVPGYPSLRCVERARGAWLALRPAITVPWARTPPLKAVLEPAHVPCVPQVCDCLLLLFFWCVGLGSVVV
jgi:hypothetical protein